jgi:hypothetical protein
MTQLQYAGVGERGTRKRKMGSGKAKQGWGKKPVAIYIHSHREARAETSDAKLKTEWLHNGRNPPTANQESDMV